MCGVDISIVAITRAKNYYKNQFFVGALPNLLNVKNDQYDFISCFEALYYLSDLTQIEEALIQIVKKGTKNCIYAISTTVIGETVYRKHPTHQEADALLSKHFNILHQFPINIDFSKLSLLMRVYFYICKKIFRKEKSIEICKKIIKESKENYYQICYVCSNK